MSLLIFSLRLLAALLLGAVVGLERQWRQLMAGTRTTALVAAGASAFVMCAFTVQGPGSNEAQIVSYVVSGVGFLGAGVIFKDAGSVQGLNTAATIWCSAAIGKYSSAPPRLPPLSSTWWTPEQEVTYGLGLVRRPEDESHIRALLLQGMSQTRLYQL